MLLHDFSALVRRRIVVACKLPNTMLFPQTYMYICRLIKSTTLLCLRDCCAFLRDLSASFVRRHLANIVFVRILNVVDHGRNLIRHDNDMAAPVRISDGYCSR